MRYFLLLLVAMPLIAAPAQRLDHWRIIGPGGGGAQFNPTISPHDPRRVLVGCDMTGSYISEDAGASWRMFNLRDRARFFVFDPREPDTIYVGAGALWRSMDAAKSWTLVQPDPATIEGWRMPGDHAEFEISSSSKPARHITALAIDPKDSQVLYAAFAEPQSNMLYRSRDRGATWQALDRLPGQVQKIGLAKDDIEVLGRDFSATCRSACNTKNTPVTFLDTAIAGSTFYGISAQDVFVSTDGGAGWRKSQLPGTGSVLRAVAAGPANPATAYVSYSRLKDSTGTYFGVAKTTDAGQSWELAWKESTTPASNVHDAWLTARFGPSWSENPLSLGVAPSDANIVYGTDFGRTLRSTDGGRTWNAAYSDRTPQGAFTTNGMDVTTAYGVHTDPFDPKRVFISYTDIGLFRSDDNGAGWTSATTRGIPREWVNTTYWLLFDPSVRGRAWAVMSGTHDLPRPKMWRRTSVQTYRGGVAASDDGGNTWHVSNRGMEPTAATHIILDPRSPQSARVLYVAAFGRGVYKSVDSGRTWVLKNDGLPAGEPFAWRLAQDRDGVLYVILARRSDDGSYGNRGDGALYRSQDDAGHWTRINLPSGVNGPDGLAIDPRDPKRLYLAAWGRATPAGAVDGGVYLSTDGGASWHDVLARDQHIYDVTIDPRNPDILYACGFESSAWRSPDRGKTWSRIRGYNFKWGHRVIPDPNDPSMIYITTFGGSVWRGPATGDPKAPEDIATPRLAYTRAK